MTEDYRWRMVTPLKGDAASVPINDAARKVVDSWDPAKDEAAGNQCKAYGAAAIMRVPGRLHITWQDDDNTHLRSRRMRGTQTRLLHLWRAASSKWPSELAGLFVRARWEPAVPPGPAGAPPRIASRALGRNRRVLKLQRRSYALDTCERTAYLTATRPASTSISIGSMSLTAISGSPSPP